MLTISHILPHDNLRQTLDTQTKKGTTGRLCPARCTLIRHHQSRTMTMVVKCHTMVGLTKVSSSSIGSVRKLLRSARPFLSSIPIIPTGRRSSLNHAPPNASAVQSLPYTMNWMSSQVWPRRNRRWMVDNHKIDNR